MSRRLQLTLLGLAGAVCIALGGTRLAGTGASRWWFELRIPPGHAGNGIVLYLGIALLGGAWLALGRTLPPVRRLWAIGAFWCLPLLAGQALFSHDAYSYLAQGTIAHLGLDPYHDLPIVLRSHGYGHVLAAVDPFWRHTTAPYGPGFLGAAGLIVGVSGNRLIAGVLLIRLLELAGLVLLAVFVPRLARTRGSDPARATWLAMLSPLALLELVASAHNDVLMAGLLVAGVSVALNGRPLLGIALCALAATIKVPAIVGVVFVAVAWTRSLPSPRERWRALGLSVGTAVGVVLAVVAVTGLGFGWVSSSVFGTPAKVRLAITPATALGYTVAHLLRDLGVSVGVRHMEGAFGVAAFALAAGFGAVCLWRTRLDNLGRMIGMVLLGVAVCGPAAWPWYFTWGLVLLAAEVPVQRSRLLPAALAAGVLVVKANGILALPIGSSPAVLAVYVAFVVWLLVRRGRRLGALAGGQHTALRPSV